MIPSFVLIIGAMKCGTTTLYDYLAQHPQIAICDEKEPGFFAFEEIWKKGLDWYESKFNFDPNQHRYALEASTDYTKYPFCQGVAARLKFSAPRRIKLIYIMRHPLRRIESQAKHAHYTKMEIGNYPSPRKSHSFDTGISPVALAVSRYASQIDIFSEYFDRGDLLLLTLENLEREPDVVLGRVCEFLGIANVPLSTTSIKSNTASGHLPVPALWRRLSEFSILRHIAKNYVPEGLRARAYELAKRMTPLEGRFVLNRKEERELIFTLAPDLVRLREAYGIDSKKEWGMDV